MENAVYKDHDEDDIIEYEASPTGIKFHASDSFVRLLMGPIGSGKSVTCCFDIFKLANEQEQDKFGVRRTRWAVIRNTYRELVDTTCRTWWDWFPKNMGVWLQKDMSHRIINYNDDGTTTDMEVLFRALDKPKDIKKLLSMELTGGWINEGREIPKQILDALIGRVGRYPPPKDGTPATWSGVLIDTNPPDTDSWIYTNFEEDNVPEGWEIFKQPSGQSKEAENIENLPADYYSRMIPGKDNEWINVYVHGKYGYVADGKPIWPEYNDDIHCTHNVIPINYKLPVYIGIDFGRTPAASFAQYDETYDVWYIIDELVTTGMGAETFGKLLHRKITDEYKGTDIAEITGDPAGDDNTQSDEDTLFDILYAQGVSAEPAYTNDTVIRIGAVSAPMMRLNVAGRPSFQISTKCKTLRKGLNGGFKYKRMQVSGSERYADKPDKNKYSHVCESLQYLMLGGGEGYKLVDTKGAGSASHKVLGALK